MPFLNELDTILTNPDEDLWTLDQPLIYRSEADKQFVVPKGFTCDMASIPRLPLTWWLFKGADTHRPGVLHDWLCRTAPVPRAQADALFYEALRSEGVGIIRARMMWAAVRVFSAARKYQAEE